MRKEFRRDEKDGFPKVRLAIGAASLFLFIVGLKRSYQHDEPSVPREQQDPGR